MRFNPEALTIRVNRQGKPLRVPERLLLSICRPVMHAPALPVATHGYTLENCLDFGKRMIPDFPACLRGRTVLDFGCGHGFQAIAMAKAGARHVHGVDIIPEFLKAGRSLAARTKTGNVSFSSDAEPGGYDVVISLGAMEHFGDPAAILRHMLSLARERVLISFAEPWFSPYGTHLNGTTRVPWLNLIFSERTLINVRNLYPDGADGATCFSEISGGLNKMTVRRFEKLVSSLPDVEVETLKLTGVRNLSFSTRLPVLRELMTSAITCVLRKVGAVAPPMLTSSRAL